MGSHKIAALVLTAHVALRIGLHDRCLEGREVRVVAEKNQRSAMSPQESIERLDLKDDGSRSWGSNHMSCWEMLKSVDPRPASTEYA